ncbi:LuxR C-terminal-related transcriptional regulator, partial [Streptomyces sp.]|uniref:LuxR C-terminal-related transcriptional regulator n=1 Tax=Streptomyces sp. TaxID=1931 RepID=UPI002D4CF812|nr:hypothetical protein [Streptomyces sp.]
LYVATETVRTHQVNLLGKLGVDSRLQAVVFGLRHGLVDIGAAAACAPPRLHLRTTTRRRTGARSGELVVRHG